MVKFEVNFYNKNLAEALGYKTQETIIIDYQKTSVDCLEPSSEKFVGRNNKHWFRVSFEINKDARITDEYCCDFYLIYRPVSFDDSLKLDYQSEQTSHRPVCLKILETDHDKFDTERMIYGFFVRIALAIIKKLRKAYGGDMG